MDCRNEVRLGLHPILYHPGIVLHNWGNLLFLSLLCLLYFTASMWWNWVPTTSCYPPPLYNTVIFPLLDVKMFCWICPDSVPRLLVPCTSDVFHILVVHVGMVYLLPWLVFRAGTTAEQFRRIPEWRGAIFGPRNTNQTWVQHIFYHPNIPIFHSILWVN